MICVAARSWWGEGGALVAVGDESKPLSVEAGNEITEVSRRSNCLQGWDAHDTAGVQVRMVGGHRGGSRCERAIWESGRGIVVRVRVTLAVMPQSLRDWCGGSTWSA